MHHMIADRLRHMIADRRGLGTTLDPDEYDRIAASLTDPAVLPYLFLGCQGPDFLFFNTKDMDPRLKALVEAYFDVTDFIEYFKRELIKLVPQPVLDALAAFDEFSQAVVTSSSTLTELQQTFTDMQAVLTALTATLTEAVKRFVSEFALFDLVSHPYRDGVPLGAKPAGFQVAAERAAGTNEWWWFDALHYRKTGKFAEQLLRNTTAGSPEHVYAIGYLTHVAADTVGHPYVNAISAGPYRSQAQRHKASENYQDVFNFLNVRGQDWNLSAIHALYNFNYQGVTDTPNDIPDPFTNLPPDLAKLIAEALNAVYQEDADPTRPEYAKPVTPDDINDTYRLWYLWLKNSTDTGTLPPPVPYSLTAELTQVYDQALQNLGDIGTFVSDAANRAGSMGIWGIFLMLGALVLAAAAVALALIDAVLGALTTLATSTIRRVACLIYEQIYQAFDSFRLGVAMNGLAFPLPQHLTDPRIVHFGNPSLTDTRGVSAQAIQGQLPLLRWTGSGILHNGRHLIYPPLRSELPPVFATPGSYFDKESTWYAWGDIPQAPGVLDALEKLVPDPDPRGNDDGSGLAQVLDDKHLLGNALSLTQALYDRQQAGGRLPDFNLDGDRGYGFLCWQQQGDPAADFPDPATSTDLPPGMSIRFIR